MTRIIAGTLKGRTLHVPPSGTRPTSERVREAMFSRLEHMDVIEGARVLDLYAGRGALGFEALSRGADQLTLVDSAQGALRTLKKNAALVAPGSIVIGADALAAVSGRLSGQYDLVFIDPPYECESATITEILTALCAHLSPDASVVVERSTRSTDIELPEGLICEDQRDWGETRVLFLAPPLPQTAKESE